MRWLLILLALSAVAGCKEKKKTKIKDCPLFWHTCVARCELRAQRYVEHEMLKRKDLAPVVKEIVRAQMKVPRKKLKLIKLNARPCVLKNCVDQVRKCCQRSATDRDRCRGQYGLGEYPSDAELLRGL